MRRGARSGERRWALSGLKRAELSRVARGPMAGRQGLSLLFDEGRAAISSVSYEGLVRPPRDQDAAFAAFCRDLLVDAADAAPTARFLRGAPAIASTLVWAMALLGAGAGVTILFAAVSGSAALGLDLGSRLLFAALIVGCAWPWLTDEARRAFDPHNLPGE